MVRPSHVCPGQWWGSGKGLEAFMHSTTMEIPAAAAEMPRYQQTDTWPPSEGEHGRAACIATRSYALHQKQPTAVAAMRNAEVL